MIANTETIEVLNLSENMIGPEGLQQICSSLALNKSVKMLDIQRNEIPDESLKMLLALLFKNETILEIKYSLVN